MSNVTFFANQEVTAEDLNAIATDLGGESPGFVDGETYAVEELNKITAAIVNEGVSINGFTPSIADSVISIASGIAYFADGYKFRLEDTVSMSVDITDGYVYLLKNDDQSVELLATEEEPPEGAILLALLVGSKIDDRRTYATSKVEGLGGSAYQIVLPAYYEVDTTSSEWQLHAQIHPAFTPKYLIINDRAYELPEEGEYSTILQSGIIPYERFSIEGDVIKMEYCRPGVYGSLPPEPFSGYVELR